MTNLVASIVVMVVTNVASVDNSRTECSVCGLSNNTGLSHISHFGMECDVGGQYYPATEKTKTTTVTEVKRLTFKWEGKDWNGEVRKVLSKKVKRWKKLETWEEVGDE